MSGTAGTSGGWRGPSGGRVWTAMWCALAALLLAKAVVNAESVIDEMRRAGHSVAPWEPWTWELTSAIGWAMVMPLLALMVLRLKPPRLGPVVFGAIVLIATVPISLLHVGIMVAAREAVYAAAGQSYSLAGTLADGLLYEWRKDAVDCVMLAATFLLVDWIARRSTPAATAPERIEVRDGARTTWLSPDDVQRVEAAGNYVELHARSGPLLHRATLSEMEALLAPQGVVRIHRSRLVRRAAVRQIETTPSGDFEALLDDGSRVGGSRRYRSALDAG